MDVRDILLNHQANAGLRPAFAVLVSVVPGNRPAIRTQQHQEARQDAMIILPYRSFNRAISPAVGLLCQCSMPEHCVRERPRERFGYADGGCCLLRD